MGREGKDWERTREETPVVKAAKPALDHATRSTRHPEPTTKIAVKAAMPGLDLATRRGAPMSQDDIGGTRGACGG